MITPTDAGSRAPKYGPLMGFFLLIFAIAVVAIAGIAFLASRGKHTTPDEEWGTPEGGDK